MATDVLAFERFRAHWTAVGAPGESARAAYDALLAAWDEPHRAYHTRRHLEACLVAFDGCVSAFSDADVAALALWYHDAVYSPLATDNEARSADLARHHLAGASPDAVERITALIDATRHAAEPTSPDACLVVDIDLGILGSSPERYAVYEDEIRREYAMFPDELFRPGRAAVLRRFLGGPIFRTPGFAHLESRARANLEWAIDRLS